MRPPGALGSAPAAPPASQPGPPLGPIAQWNTKRRDRHRLPATSLPIILQEGVPPSALSTQS